MTSQAWAVVALGVVAVVLVATGNVLLALSCAFLIWAVSDRE